MFRIDGATFGSGVNLFACFSQHGIEVRESTFVCGG